jgi:endonuclease/exonuclease/phosphatase family metal-dependent hydrolase
VVIVREIDQQNGWLRISRNNEPEWIIDKYIAEVLPDNVVISEPNYVVGSWNLEHFHDGAARGFPENTMGGPSYPARSQSDYEAIAAIIETLEVRILVLEEVYAREIEVDGEADVRSQEVENLIDILGPGNYDYVISQSGGSQHIAILYDTRYSRLNSVCECDLPNENVNGKSLFYRQPLIAHFTFLNGGEPRNDLAIVGVHLASGQHRTGNHDRAMELLVEELRQVGTDAECIPPDENDILITGDFNANRFDNRQEQFWSDMENNGWDVLGDTDANYPATRLSGHPLGLHNSKIDYIIVTRGGGGLGGEEILARQANVWTELIGSDPVSFRRNASDHIPVTVEVRVMDDTD